MSFSLAPIHTLAVHSSKEPYRKECVANFFLYIRLKGICVCASSVCTFSFKYNAFQIGINSCLSASLTFSAVHSHPVLPNSYEDRDVEKRLELTWLMLNLRLHSDVKERLELSWFMVKLRLHLADLLPRMGWWHKGLLFCSYCWHPLHFKPSNRDAQNIFFWTSVTLYKLINKQTTKY